MAFEWSFSAERCFRRCQRQYFFREVAAWHNSRDAFRREAFLLKQLKTLDLWRGLLVHAGIQRFVIPHWQARQRVDWDNVIAKTSEMAEAQFRFSLKRMYREKVAKSKIPYEYCALQPHELGLEITGKEKQEVFQAVENSFRNLAAMSDLLKQVEQRPRYWAELPVSIQYHGAQISARLDLLYFRGYGKPTIIDWKVYDSNGGSDAHLQTAVYAWLLCRSPQWSVKSPEDVELLEVKLLDASVFSHRFDHSRFDELEDRVYRGIEEMRSLCNDGTFKSQDLADYDYAGNPNTCSYCAFADLCRRSSRWQIIS